MSKIKYLLKRLGLTGYTHYVHSTAFPKSVRTYTADEQMIALIDNLYLAGYFQQQNIWNLVHMIGDLDKPARTFSLLDLILKKAGAYQADPARFDAEFVLNHLFEEDEFSEADILDFLTYWRQTAFARNTNQERNELRKEDWMATHQERFIKNAETLGVIHAVPNFKSEYYETWVLGAARLRMTTRLQSLHRLTKLGVSTGVVRVLAGARELWAEIDGIGDTPEVIKEEGKRYLFEMATKMKLNLDPQQSFIDYGPNDDIPQGRVKGRTYLNYTSSESRRLTESSMAIDIYGSIFGKMLASNMLIDTELKDGQRPNTVSTSSQAATIFVKSLKTSMKRCDILVISEQPYLKRQCIAVERSIRQGLQEVGSVVEPIIHGVGNESSVGVSVINSELGALGAEQYLLVANEIPMKRPSTALMYRTRSKDISTIPKFEPEVIRKTAINNQQYHTQVTNIF